MAKLDRMQDSDIDLGEIAALDRAFFSKAELRLPMPKNSVSIRLDHDVLDWFRKQGRGYQTRINAVLRLYMEGKAAAGGSAPRKV